MRAFTALRQRLSREAFAHVAALFDALPLAALVECETLAAPFALAEVRAPHTAPQLGALASLGVCRRDFSPLVGSTLVLHGGPARGLNDLAQIAALVGRDGCCFVSSGA